MNIKTQLKNTLLTLRSKNLKNSLRRLNYNDFLYIYRYKCNANG